MKTIECKIAYESMISRLPGLFAYLEYNELGECVLCHATDSDMGCYGKIVENIKLPEGLNFFTYDDDGSLALTLEGGKTYSYRTLIRYYYDYRESEIELNSDFISFIERGIGKRIIDDAFREEYGFTDENDLLPNFIYLATARSLYNEMVKLKKQCDFYQIQLERGEEVDKTMCCLCNRYERMGGEKLIDVLRGFIEEADMIQSDYYGYAMHNAPLTLELTVDLTNTIEDLGIVTPAIEEWLPNKRYYGGQYVIYDGDVWFHKEMMMAYGKTVEGEITEIITVEGWEGKDEQDQTEYRQIFVVVIEYNNGDKTIPIKEFLALTPEEKLDYKPVLNTKTSPDETDTPIAVVSDKDYTCGKLNEYKVVEFDGEKYYEKVSYDFPKVNDPTTYNGNSVLPIEINGECESDLPSLRRMTTFLDSNLKPVVPSKEYDWLYYYRKGIVCGTPNVVCDDLGNIMPLYKDEDGIIRIDENREKCNTEENAYKCEGGYKIENDSKVCLNLCAYGNIITDITSDNDKKQIKFEYVINAHLKAKQELKQIDEDGNVLYMWGDFEYDDSSDYGKNIGTKYTETYNYEEGSDLEKLIEGQYTQNMYETTVGNERTVISKEDYDKLSEQEKSGYSLITYKFSDYIKGDYDKILTNVKFEFITTNSLLMYEKRIGTEMVVIPYAKSKYETHRNTTEDFMSVPIIRQEYYQGISYAPTRDIQVKIERGNTSVFEKHIRFGECKTLDDLTEFSNGSFFRISTT